ncbi:iron ABC transporter permease [Agreia sp. COWG]|uniref:FecCD family ABC transporter permease n=1 Tax=Agreia sp. COWG TaxID=2773266 RepID=UPI001AFBD0C7|nr:iron ABC transporter permease [Agreia sp. COWG]CAD5990526.1 iron-enterobactin transporter subunit; membrane component of ABC superfamily [Agreia sp. COWG]
MSVDAQRLQRRGRLAVVLTAGAATLVAFALLSLAIGSKNLSLGEVWNGLLSADGSRESIIVWQLRMPRTLLAIVAGAALAVSGVLMQALTRNPLAEPGLLGVNAGAAFSVVIAISVFGATQSNQYLWFAFVGAGAAAVFVYLISIRRTQASDHARLVLAGVALTASLGACTRIITLFDATAFDSYRFWVIGSVANRGFDTIFSVLPFIAAGLVIALLSGPSLNALALGDEQAVSLGVPVTALRVLVIATITLLCGAATAAAGPIAFVGLVVPHVLRLVVGVDQRTILVLSALVGPSLVLAADVIGRLVAQPSELEVGVVTAFIGAPVLIILLLRRRPV